ncbi:MAG: hypothetical protein ACRDF5_01355, partial [bacterium]
MTDAERGARTRGAQRWRALAEIGLFAAVAAALLTGPDISSVGRALAQFPGSSLSQPQTAQPSAP